MITISEPLVFGPADRRSVEQLRNCQQASGEPAEGVLCADHHLGYAMPIGGVMALREKIMPAGVGFDIACGNCAVRTDMPAAALDAGAAMDEIARTLSFGVGRRNREPVDHLVLDEIAHAGFERQRGMARLAADQLGTIGAGNHYVDLFVDDDGWVWVGVHFGSRGFGHKTAAGFLNLMRNRRWEDTPSEPERPGFIGLDTDLGQAYVEAMELAGRYAYAGREWVVARVLRILGAGETDRVHNHHNFAWREEHGGETLWVVRKGATPAWPGQRGFVGASMGDDAVIVVGRESARSKAALYSTVHGAGRVMSRSAAAGPFVKPWRCLDYRNCDGRLPPDTPKQAHGGNPRCPRCGGKTKRSRSRERDASRARIDWNATLAALREKKIELRGGAADEAPGAYKRLEDVLAYHGDTIDIQHRLHPVGVAMAGPDEFDPYKD